MINLTNAWQLSPITLPNSFGTTFLYNNQILVVGGLIDTSADATNSCYSSSINSDGTLAPFKFAGAVPVSPATPYYNNPAGYGMNVSSGLIYCLGGNTTSQDTGGATLSTIFSLKLNSNGTITSFISSDVTPFSTPQDYGTSINASNGWFYVINGANSSANNVQTVWAMQINDNGNLINYKQIAQLPTTFQSGGLFSHSVVEMNGNLIVSGGEDNTGTIRAEMYKARLMPNGDLSNWVYIGNMPSGPRVFHSSVVFGDTLVIVAGESTGFSPLSTIDLIRFDTNTNVISATTHPALLPITGGISPSGVVLYNGIVYLIAPRKGSLNPPYTVQYLSLK